VVCPAVVVIFSASLSTQFGTAKTGDDEGSVQRSGADCEGCDRESLGHEAMVGVIVRELLFGGKFQCISNGERRRRRQESSSDTGRRICLSRQIRSRPGSRLALKHHSSSGNFARWARLPEQPMKDPVSLLSTVIASRNDVEL
jgi:hypothetical protein